jgi:hypothetical protein
MGQINRNILGADLAVLTQVVPNLQHDPSCSPSITERENRSIRYRDRAQALSFPLLRRSTT